MVVCNLLNGCCESKVLSLFIYFLQFHKTFSGVFDTIFFSINEFIGGTNLHVFPRRLLISSPLQIEPQSSLSSEYKTIRFWFHWNWSSLVSEDSEVGNDCGDTSLHLQECKPETWKAKNSIVKILI